MSDSTAANGSGEGEFARKIARATYACSFVLTAAGVWNLAFGGWLFVVVFFLPLLLLGALLVLLVTLPLRWRSQGWRSVLPFFALLLIVPAMRTFGPRLQLAHFEWNRDRYDSIARALRAGTRTNQLQGDEEGLAHRVTAMKAGDLASGAPDPLQIVGVEFLVAPHGYAGNVGLIRVFDSDAARHLDRGRGAVGWTSSRRLSDGWYRVAN